MAAEMARLVPSDVFGRARYRLDVAPNWNGLGNASCATSNQMEDILMGSKKRELISPQGDKRYVRRDDQGRITESDDVGRSLRGTGAKPRKPL